MEELKIPRKYQDMLEKFAAGLKDIYADELVSLALYGSAASGEFAGGHSNLNLLVVLKNTDLQTLKKASMLLNKFKAVNPLFLSPEYISGSTDIFPIEFLDMKENYSLVYGRDILKDIQVDARNLRFQCEQELKAKLLKLRQGYVALNNDASELRGLLFASFTSILHIARNLLRIKGLKPPYLKSEIMGKIASEFNLDINIWKKILAAKNKQIKLPSKEIEQLFVSFVKELELIVDIAEKAD